MKKNEQQINILDIKQIINNTDYSTKRKHSFIRIYEAIGTEVFGNNVVATVLGCGPTTATKHIKMMEELGIIKKVEGAGKGKYRFISDII